MLERRYRRTLRADDRLAWIRQVRSMHSLFEKKEGLYWTNRITSCSGNSRRLWKSMSSLLRRGKSTATKPSSSITADKLAQFFADKVAAVRSETKDAPSPTFTQRSLTQLSSFNEVSAVDVRRVLTSSPAKTCTRYQHPFFLTSSMFFCHSSALCATLLYGKAAFLALRRKPSSRQS